MELYPGLPVVHHHRVMSDKQVLGVVAQRQSNHVLLLGVVGGNVAPRVLQRQRRRRRNITRIACTNTMLQTVSHTHTPV